MGEDKKNRVEAQVVAGLFVIGIIVFLFLFFSENEAFFHSLVKTYGIVGLFFGAMLANATVLLPIPFDAVVFLVGADPSLVGLQGFWLFGLLMLGVLVGFGAAIGETTAYFVGLFGVKAAEKIANSKFSRLSEMREKISSQGMAFIFLGAFIPFPFDLIGISAGIMQYSFPKFFVATFMGKSLRAFLVALAGHFGLILIAKFFLVG
ncbi:MAG: VTT domain-containing protein [archaeon]|nr:VTT domain-containing protein [archaeon]